MANGLFNGNVDRRSFLALLSAGLAGCAAGGLGHTPGMGGRRPNVIVILADDLGYGDTGVYGCRDIPTPNIDAIARDGVRFTQAYSNCPVCSPTRAALLTGRYQQRFSWERNPAPYRRGVEYDGVPADEIFLSQIMRDAGYATALVGKWHLGTEPQYRPLQRGFDEFMGFLGGAHPYFHDDKLPPIYRGDEEILEKEYLTDAFTREAVDFIKRNSARPFFLYLAYNAVHTPMDATEEYLARFGGIADRQRRIHAAMTAALDDGVGRVRQALREAGLEKDTLVIFLSDNGGTPVNSSDNGPLRGFKGQVYEGGIRVPFMICQPGSIPGGRVLDQPVIGTDIMPTVAALTGAALPGGRPLDGENLLPLLRAQESTLSREALYWRWRDTGACQKENWKYIAGAEPELYNLQDDIGEKNNLAASEPGRLKELQNLYNKWDAEMGPALRPEAAERRPGRRKRN